MLGRVFEPFMQIKSGADISQDGLGVGLALAWQLIKMHGGTIVAHSEGSGHGSEFIVRLPLYEHGHPPEVARADADRVRPTSLPAGDDLSRLIDRRILIVDDNHDGADSLSMLLELMHCNVRKAYDGMEAIAIAREFAPEAILLDIGMPRLDGYEACRLIRQEPWGARTAIIALTGWGQEADRRRTSESGFDAHLVKPIHPDSAVKMLVDLLASRDVG
jgi:CheY-like chemotaxis protein